MILLWERNGTRPEEPQYNMLNCLLTLEPVIEMPKYQRLTKCWALHVRNERWNEIPKRPSPAQICGDWWDHSIRCATDGDYAVQKQRFDSDPRLWKY